MNSHQNNSNNNNTNICCNLLSSTCSAASNKWTSATNINNAYIYELPYNTRKALCDLLDADGSWRQLGGEYMHLNDTQLTLISHALYRGASPTNDLLTRWEASNPRVRQLYKYLSSMRHQRAMIILKPYVEEKLQALCMDPSDDDDDDDDNNDDKNGLNASPVHKNGCDDNKYNDGTSLCMPIFILY